MNTLDKLSLLSPSEPSIPDNKKKLDRDRASLKKSCRQFEAIFIQSMFKSMRKTLPDGGLFKKDNAHAIYQDMFDAEIANEISTKQSMGLADQMYRQMEKYLSNSEKNDLVKSPNNS